MSRPATFSKGRDIEKVYVKNTANYLTFTIVNKHLFSTANKLKLFITGSILYCVEITLERNGTWCILL